MGHIFSDITETVGRTRLVEMKRMTPPGGARIVAKLESFDSPSSVKDRIGVSMIEAAEREGRITPGLTTLVEPANLSILRTFAGPAGGGEGL